MKRKQNKIKVTPEGREGLFLLDKEEAIKFIKSLSQKEIHSLSYNGNDNGIFYGCDWKKKDVIEFLNDEHEFPFIADIDMVKVVYKKVKVIKIAIMVLPDTETMKHQLVALTEDGHDKRYSFDVGEIKAEDLEIQ